MRVTISLLRVVLPLLVLALLLPGLAAPVRKQVLLPGGKSAAGARILVRTYDDATHGYHEEAVTADGQGWFTFDYTESKERGPFTIDPSYLVIDVANGPLAFLALRTSAQPNTPVLLPEGQPLRGKVIDGEGKPVAGATVTPALCYSPRSGNLYVAINAPLQRVATPQLSAVTDAEGQFATRPLHLGLTAINGVITRAECTQAGISLVGSSLLPLSGATPGRGPAAKTETTITLRPAVQVTGRVIDAIEKKPIAGAQVRLVPKNLLTADMVLAPVTTNADGAFTFTGVLPEPRGWAVDVSHPQFADHWESVNDDTAVALFRWTELTGTVRDQEDQVPVGPITVRCAYQPSCGTSNETYIGRKITTAPMKADGTFTLKLPLQDRDTLSVDAAGVGYRGSAAPVVPGGAAKLMVTRQSGLLVKLEGIDADLFPRLTCVSTRVGVHDTRMIITGKDDYFFLPRTLDLAQCDVQIGMNGRERATLIPWTTVDLTQTKWPLILKPGEGWSKVLLRLTNADGTPLQEQPTVTFVPKGEREPQLPWQITLAPGLYQALLPRGEYQATVETLPGAETRPLTVVPGENTLTWQLPPLAAAVLTFLNADGRPTGEMPSVSLQRLTLPPAAGVPKFDKREHIITYSSLTAGEYQLAIACNPFGVIDQRTLTVKTGINRFEVKWAGNASVTFHAPKQVNGAYVVTSIALHYLQNGEPSRTGLVAVRAGENLAIANLPAGAYEVTYNCAAPNTLPKQRLTLKPGANTFEVPE